MARRTFNGYFHLFYFFSTVCLILVSVAGTSFLFLEIYSIDNFGKIAVELEFFLLFLFAILLVVFLSIKHFMSCKLVDIVQDFRDQALSLDFQHSTKNKEALELHYLFSNMKLELADKIKGILLQKDEQEAILSSMTEGILTVDNEGKICQLNQAGMQILQLRIEVGKGRSVQEAIRLPELQSFIFQGSGNEERSEKEIDMGDSRYLHIRGGPLYTNDGQRNGGVFVFSDITRLKELESHRQEFVSNVSHELRTPLTSIQGFSETLLQGDISPVQQKNFLGIIHRHTTRLGKIIDDLLSLSKMEKIGSEEIEKSEESLIIIFESVVALFSEGKTKDREIIYNCPERLYVEVNRPMLEQALVNLISNGIKYSGEKIILEASVTDSELSLAVIDQGQGISKADLTRVFERFYRVDEARARNIGGAGLGLAIVKHIAVAHGGRVEVESTVGKGSRFIIYLPLGK